MTTCIQQSKYQKVATATLFPRAPFHFDGTFNKPSRFPSRLLKWSPGTLHQTVRLRDQIYGVVINDEGRLDKPALEVSVYHNASVGLDIIGQLLNELSCRYALDENLAPFCAKVERDRRFGRTLARWRGVRSSSPYSLYELLVIALVLQNTIAKRSVTMLDALLVRFGTPITFDGCSLDAIWAPEQLDEVSEDEIRGLKIGYRARSLKRFSAQFSRQEISEGELRTLGEDDLRRRLLAIYGVGPETARILMTEVFHRRGAFGHISPWQQKLYPRLLFRRKLASADSILDFLTDRFGEHRELALHYLWEDLFWRHRAAPIDWLERELRL